MTPEQIALVVNAQREAVVVLRLKGWKQTPAEMVTPEALEALLTSQPREWTVETIGDAPDDGGALIWDGDWKRWEWCRADVDSTPMKTAKRLVSQQGRYERAFGPIPQPPTVRGEETHASPPSWDNRREE